MRRKLVKQGIRALTITIPASWAQSNGLRAGDEIEVQEMENTLTLSTTYAQQQQELIVDVSGLPPRLADRFIARSYQKGYDKIIVKFDSPELMLAVKNKVPELMGYEILNIDKKKMDIQVISSSLDLDFDTLLRRAFRIVIDMGETCYTAWKKMDMPALEHVAHQDIDVNKFAYFCLRELNKSVKRASFGRSILYYLIENLEDLGDEFKVLGKTLAETGKPDQKVLAVISDVNRMLQLSYEFFYSPEKQKAVEAFTLSKEVEERIEDALLMKDKNLIKALVSLETARRIIYHFTTMRLDTLKGMGGE